MTCKTSKILTTLCIGIVFALGVSCQLHASPHTHSIPDDGHASHHDESSSSSIDDMVCIAAVIPPIDGLFGLLALKYDLSPPALKPLLPAFELYIPPRFSV